MSFRTLVTSDELFAHLDDPDWAILDCRFSLVDMEHGRREYQKGHVAGAVYAHLEEDLSGPIVPGTTGRHPLPEVADFARKLGSWGIDERVQVVVYDDMGGAMAGRLWWMLGWVGHDAVALLDGGWQRWCAGGRPVTAEMAARPARVFAAAPRPERLVPAAEVLSHLGDSSAPLIDARAGERYRGEVEPLDPVAGHIPGAVCAAFEENLSRTGPSSPARSSGSASAPSSATRPRSNRCPTAAQASPPATTCSPWSTRGSPADDSTQAPGATGSPIPTARWSAAEAFSPVSTRPGSDRRHPADSRPALTRDRALSPPVSRPGSASRAAPSPAIPLRHRHRPRIAAKPSGPAPEPGAGTLR